MEGTYSLKVQLKNKFYDRFWHISIDINLTSNVFCRRSHNFVRRPIRIPSVLSSFHGKKSPLK